MAGSNPAAAGSIPAEPIESNPLGFAFAVTKGRPKAANFFKETPIPAEPIEQADAVGE